jgi:hypothetical protein
MRHVHVTATWQSEHLVELDDESDLAGLIQLLGGQSNVKLVGYTALPLEDVVDAAVDKLLGPGDSTRRGSKRAVASRFSSSRRAVCRSRRPPRSARGRSRG